MPTGFHELLVCDPVRSRGTTHVFISRPSPVEERSLGRLFVVAEIASRDRVNLDLLKGIQDAVKEQYYRSSRESLEAALEEALTAGNGRIAELVGDFGRGWLERLNLVIAATRGREVYFATIGNPHVLLIHRGRIIDLLAQLAPPAEAAPINPLKAFTSTYAGALEEGDYLLCLSSAFFDYISQEKVKRLFIEGNPEHAMRSLEQLLTENANDAAFAGLAVSLTPEPAFTAVRRREAVAAQPGPPVLPTAPQTSLEALMAREAATEEILRPNVWRSVGRALRAIGRRLRVSFRSLVLRKPTRISPALERLRAERASVPPPEYGRETRSRLLKRERELNLPASVRRGAKATLFGVVGVVRSIGNVFRRGPAVREELREMPKRPRSLLNRIVIAVKRLPRSRRIILLAVILILFVVTQSLAVGSRNRTGGGRPADLQTTVAAIEEKTNAAQASLLYGDESGARKLLAEATALLDDMPNSKTGRSERNRLDSLIAGEREKLQHRVTIPAPAVFADVGDVAGAGVSGLSANANVAAAINPSENTLITIQRATKKVAESAAVSQTGNFQYATLAGSSLLVVNTDATLTELNLSTGRGLTRAFSLPADANVGAVETYESRLYLLDVKTGQIWRAARTGTGFGTPTRWLAEDDANLQNAVSLAIDGSIYVLGKDGALRKFTQGKTVAFGLDPVEPALASGLEVVASTELASLYILDAREKRLLVFTKDGALVRQYTSPAFTDLRGVAVVPDGSTAYVLNGTTVYELPLTESGT